MSTTDAPVPPAAAGDAVPPDSTAALGRAISGPTALGSSPARLWQLTRVLALTDFKLKFFGSVLGYLWQIMRPLLQFGVLFTVFTQVVKLGKGETYYATSLLLGIVSYGFLSEATGGSVKSLIDRESLVRRIEFPRLAVPMAVVLTAMMNLGLNLIPVVIAYLIQGGTPRWQWVELPLIFAFFALLVLGLGMLLSSMYVKYRDTAPIWDVVVLTLFYGSPIFYTLKGIGGAHHQLVIRLLLSNPFAAILTQARHALLGPTHPSVTGAMGGVAWCAIPVGLTFLIVFLGYRRFSRSAPLIAEML